MKLTITLGVAIGAAALAACNQAGEDNAAEADANITADETVLPPDETAGTDTLGNQLNQLNESGNAAVSNSAENAAGNAANSS